MRAKRSLSADTIMHVDRRSTRASARPRVPPALPFPARAADEAAAVAAVVLALAHADADSSAATAVLCDAVAAGAHSSRRTARSEQARGRPRGRRAARRAISAEALRAGALMERLRVSSVRDAFESLCALKTQLRLQERSPRCASALGMRSAPCLSGAAARLARAADRRVQNRKLARCVAHAEARLRPPSPVRHMPKPLVRPSLPRVTPAAVTAERLMDGTVERCAAFARGAVGA